jgi:hypothetical protein
MTDYADYCWYFLWHEGNSADNPAPGSAYFWQTGQKKVPRPPCLIFFTSCPLGQVSFW